MAAPASEAFSTTGSTSAGSDTTIDIHDRLNDAFGITSTDRSVEQSDIDRRKFFRYSVHIPGFAVCGDQHPTRCVVWDFSAQGMRVTRVLKSALDDTQQVPACGANDEMRLVLRVPGLTEPLALTGFVRRCRQAEGLENLGLKISTVPENAYRALVSHADQVQRELSTPSAQFDQLSGWPMVAAYIQSLFNEGFRRAHERLLLLTDWKDQWDDRVQSFYAMVELRPVEERLLRLLVREVLDAMEVPEEVRRKALANAVDKAAINERPVALIEIVGRFLGPECPPKLQTLAPQTLDALLERVCRKADVPGNALPVIIEAMSETAGLYWNMLEPKTKA